MTITPTTLIRWAGVAAVAAGVIFIGVQINHPHLDATSIQTTDVVVRDTLKVLMAALALVGITGMYLHQVRQNGRPRADRLRGLRRRLPRHHVRHLRRRLRPAVARRLRPRLVNDVIAAADRGTVQR